MNYRPLSRADDADLSDIRDTLSELLDVLRVRETGLQNSIDEARSPTHDEIPAKDVLAYVKRLLTIRTARRRFLPPSYFESPALTILLDLYVSQREQRQVAVSDAIAISGVPTSTALRWIATMEADGYVTKHQDASDKRRSLLSATPRALADIERLTALWRNTA